jgi:import inner membrane translocase subunit TIM9|tara:strand:- start:1494 stop:1733 length:240 start_codon:yes stop_codon:yes gene_type:complete
MVEKLEELQLKDTLRMFNGLVERCFSECINSFRSKALSEPEDKCINMCAGKFLKHSGRVGQRFGEISMQQQAAQQQAGS